MSEILISLIGEQPVPNLLPIRHINPQEVLLAYTDLTAKVYYRLQRLLESGVRVHPLEKAEPYDIPAFQEQLERCIKYNNWKPSNLLFNLTGGTKSMGFAAYEVARAFSSKFLYLQSEGSQSKLFFYQFKNGKAVLEKSEIIPGVLSIHDYLMAFLQSYTATGFSKTDGGKFEEEVHHFLEPALDECLAGVKLSEAVDIDLVCRLGNQVAIVEIKHGEKARKKEGIDQLNTAASREFLGTYTKKILIIDRIWDHTRSNLRHLAEAHGITLIEIPSYSQHGRITETEQQKAIAIVRDRLGDIGTRP